MRVLKQNAGSLVTDPQAHCKKTKQKNTHKKKNTGSLTIKPCKCCLKLQRRKLDHTVGE